MEHKRSEIVLTPDQKADLELFRTLSDDDILKLTDEDLKYIEKLESLEGGGISPTMSSSYTPSASSEATQFDREKEDKADYDKAFSNTLKLKGEDNTFPFEDPTGLYRYRIDTQAGPRDVVFNRAVSNPEMNAFMKAKGLATGENGFPSYRELQAPFTNVVGEDPGFVKTAGAMVFPRLAEAGAKGEDAGLFGVKNIGRGIMDVASAPFRMGGAVVDQMLSPFDDVERVTSSAPSMYYTEGDTEEYTRNEAGEVVPVERSGLGAFGQETIRAPENILGFGTGAPTRVTSKIPQNINRALIEGGGNVGFEALRSYDEDRDISPVAIAMGGVAPVGMEKLMGPSLQRSAVEGLERKLKIPKSQMDKKYAPEVETIFEEGLIPMFGGVEGIQGRIKKAISQLGEERARVAQQLDDQAIRESGAGLRLHGVDAESLKPFKIGTREYEEAAMRASYDASDKMANMVDIARRAKSEIDNQLSRGSIRLDEANKLKASIDKEMEDLGRLAVPTLKNVVPNQRQKLSTLAEEVERFNELKQSGMDINPKEFKFIDADGNWSDEGVKEIQSRYRFGLNDDDYWLTEKDSEYLKELYGEEGFKKRLADGVIEEGDEEDYYQILTIDHPSTFLENIELLYDDSDFSGDSVRELISNIQEKADENIMFGGDDLDVEDPLTQILFRRISGQDYGNIPMYASGVTDESGSLPMSKFLNRRTRWFDEGKINDQKSLFEIPAEQRKVSNLLWEASGPELGKFDDIANINEQFRRLIPLEKSIFDSNIRLNNRDLLPMAGGDISALLKMIGSGLNSNLLLRARYGMGSSLQTPNIYSPRPALTRVPQYFISDDEQQMFGE